MKRTPCSLHSDPARIMEFIQYCSGNSSTRLSRCDVQASSIAGSRNCVRKYNRPHLPSANRILPLVTQSRGCPTQFAQYAVLRVDPLVNCFRTAGAHWDINLTTADRIPLEVFVVLRLLVALSLTMPSGSASALQSHSTDTLFKYCQKFAPL